MASLFDDYAVIAESGLFDAEYYLATNPEVAELDCDPLLHYLEFGASQRRNPNPTFDAEAYLAQCRERGESPANPLLHYIGVQKAIAAQSAPNYPGPEALGEPALRLALDAAFVRTLGIGPATRISGQGWAIAQLPIADLRVTIAGTTTTAQHGQPRADVANSYPHAAQADRSGFSFILDGLPRIATEGAIDIAFAVTTSDGTTHRVSTKANLTAIDDSASAAVEDTDSLEGPQPMKLEIDTSTVDSAGILTLSGWCVGLAPVISVQAFIDDQALGLADYGQQRPDVGASYPEYPDGERSGFELKTDIGAFGVGRKLRHRADLPDDAVLGIDAGIFQFPARAVHGDEDVGVLGKQAGHSVRISIPGRESSHDLPATGRLDLHQGPFMPATGIQQLRAASYRNLSSRGGGQVGRRESAVKVLKS